MGRVCRTSQVVTERDKSRTGDQPARGANGRAAAKRNHDNKILGLPVRSRWPARRIFLSSHQFTSTDLVGNKHIIDYVDKEANK